MKIYDEEHTDTLLNQSEEHLLEANVRFVDSMFPADINATDARSDIKEISVNDNAGRWNELVKQVEPKWYVRAFSPISPGSLRGSTFTLISSALGAGILSLPYMYKNTGLILGTIYLILAGCAALWSMYLLSKCSFRSGCQRYSDAVLHLLGPKWGFFLQIVLIIYVFGALVSYLITLNQFVASIAGSFQIITQDQVTNWSKLGSDEYYLTYITITIMVIVSFPVSSIKNLSGLRYLTIFGVFAVIYIIITVVWQAPIVYQDVGKLYKVDLFLISWDSLSAWAVCAFAFTCHVNVFPVISELQHAQERRTNKIFNRCIVVEEIMYLSIGLAGYISLVDKTTPIITNRDYSIGPYDIFMSIGKIAMALNLFLVVPVNLNPCRLQLMVLFKVEKNPSNALHYGITGGILVAAGGLAMLFPNIYSAFGILGGCFATMLSYSFPSLIYLKCTNMGKSHYKRWLVMLIGGTATFMGFAATAVILVKLITGSS